MRNVKSDSMRKRMLLWLGLVLACVVSVAQPSEYLLPKPQQIVSASGTFTMGKVMLDVPVLSAEWTDLVQACGGEVVEKSSKIISVRLVPSVVGAQMNQEEAYRLMVSSKGIEVEATTEQGVYWAMQTLRQLEQKKGSFKACEIVDWPAFKVRGFMQDVGRSFLPIEELKREVEILSRYKINVFHWHLTENQAWRLESKIFPMLNDSVNMTRIKGKYYTLDEAKDLVDFCKKHQVLLIPEIDMPGHSAAFVRTFRHDMQSPEGMKILKMLVDEVCETFDVPYLHIGTDEVDFWNKSFVPEMVSYIRAKGKQVISWNPGWNYKPGEVDMMQMWSFRGAVTPGIPHIDSKFHYTNHFDTFADLVALYNSRVYDRPQGDADVVGAIIALWHDRLLASEENMLLENNFYPSMLALAERTWLGGGSQYFNGDGTMMWNEKTETYQAFADFEKRMLWHKENHFQGYPFGYVKQTNVKWNITDAFPNGGDVAKVFPPEQGLKDSYEYDGKEYGVRSAIGAGIYFRHVWGGLPTSIPTFYKDAKEDHTAYAYTWVYSPKEQTVGLWAETQNYSRSEMDLPPKQGTWDYRGSRLWINDEEILPPTWTATHTVKSNEIALGNENCVARPPLEVKLNKGWNKVFWKLPVGKFRTHEVRLVKWMFTTVFVTLDGQKAVDGLVYSPEKKLK